MSLDVLGLIAWWSVPLCVALSIACLGIAGVSLRRLKGLSGRAAAAIAAASGVAVLSGYLVAVYAGDASVFVCAGAVLVGLGMALAFSSWCSVFGSMGSCRATDVVLLAVVLGSSFSLATSFFSLRGIEASFFVSAVASSILLAFCRGSVGRCEEGEPIGDVQPSVSRLSLLKDVVGSVRTSLLGACAIAFAVAITRMMSLAGVSGMGAAVNGFGMLSTGCAAVILLLLMRGKKGGRIGIPTLFQILFPIVATLLLVASASGPVVAMLVGAAVFSIYSVVFALVIPACIEGASKAEVTAVAVYGVFTGVMYALFAFATWVGMLLFTDAGVGVSASVVAVLLVFYVLAMANTFMQRRAGNDALGAPVVSGHSGSTGDSSGQALAAPDESTQGRALCETEASVASSGTEDPIERRCMAVARAYALSPRETDVLVAYAHGRNVAYLADHLVLSSNTIRSHSKTLYAKLGVHSKQELIDLVEREGDRV